MDCSPLGSSVHGLFQARILEYVAIPFTRGSSWTKVGTLIFYITGRFFILYHLSHQGSPICNPNSDEGFHFSMFSTTFVIICFYYFSHPSGFHEVALSLWPIMFSIFLLIGHISFGEMSIQVYCLLLNWAGLLLLSFKSALYVLDLSPLSERICKYFHSVGFFSFLIISLEA